MLRGWVGGATAMPSRRAFWTCVYVMRVDVDVWPTAPFLPQQCQATGHCGHCSGGCMLCWWRHSNAKPPGVVGIVGPYRTNNGYPIFSVPQLGTGQVEAHTCPPHAGGCKRTARRVLNSPSLSASIPFTVSRGPTSITPMGPNPPLLLRVFFQRMSGSTSHPHTHARTNAGTHTRTHAQTPPTHPPQ